MSFQIQLGEGQCKCLVNVANSKRHLFAVATENSERLNEIRLIEFSEVDSTIKELLKVPVDGVIEKLVNQKDQIFAISRYQNTTYISQHNSSFERVFQMQYESLTNILPHESDPILYLTTPTQIDLFDLNKQTSNNIYTSQDKFKLCQQDPYHQNLFARTQEGQLCIQDIRDKKQGQLFKAHALNILDIDFNPNKQYYLMTAGEDCMCKIWDIRKTDFAMKTLSDLTNSVLQAKFNRFHDQLVSLAFDDGSIALHNLTSVSSVPQLGQQREDDYLVKLFDEHEDSVFAMDWSRATAWVLASVGLQSHLIINVVPTEEKYKILL